MVSFFFFCFFLLCLFCWGVRFCLREGFLKTKGALKNRTFCFLGFIFYFGLFSKVVLISKNSL
ncbi:hypothetical protein AA973_00400 [Helicobacter pylori]|uniref:Uncharacterized protein n=1 Tax=Helicobacter pylori TaxID=210 RepID=A0A1A9H6W4_HELPX|nr:hypothetical protein AA973_00400 [Helicobacter pylori]